MSMEQQSVVENRYLEQVQERQAELAKDLKFRRAKMETAPTSREEPDAPRGGAIETPAVEVRITGFWKWKTVIVPPNAYVVHTRRGVPEPVTIGLGTSFRYNPATDAYLVVPSAMQTVLLNANCICRELQGILVQGYVQWTIDDFATAYKRLDFSDPCEPMRIVNIQIREQAEAVIKDMVATMSIYDVLSDKQPIIKELTERLQDVARGLGLRVVTVQIKEAVVSSAQVWSNMQRPFRSERAKAARLAELKAEAEVETQELQRRKEQETATLATDSELAKIRAAHEAETFDRELAEKARRSEEEKKLLAAQVEHFKAEQELVELRAAAELRRKERELSLAQARQKIENEVSPQNLQARLIGALPAIAEKLPRPSFALQSDGGPLASILAKLGTLIADPL